MQAIGGAVLASGALIVGECLDMRRIFDLLATLERARMLGNDHARIDDAHGV